MDDLRKAWEQRIIHSAARVKKDYRRYSDGKISLVDALVGVLQKQSTMPEIPTVLITDAEGKTEEGLMRVLDKIYTMMTTPTGQTVCLLNPEAVNLAERLCDRHSVSGGYRDRDACYFLDEVVKGRSRRYTDEVRILPQYLHRIRDSLDNQFGQPRVELALHDQKRLLELLFKSWEIVKIWTEKYERGTPLKDMPICDRVTSGLIALNGLLEQPEFESVEQAMRHMINQKERERIPYRSMMCKIRGIPEVPYEKFKS